MTFHDLEQTEKLLDAQRFISEHIANADNRRYRFTDVPEGMTPLEYTPFINRKKIYAFELSAYQLNNLCLNPHTNAT